MNKQELIKKLEERRTMTRNFQGYVVWWKDVKEIFEQLGEPQPVKVPQFVADFIAEQKKLGYTLSYSIDASMSDIVAEWYWDNSELFALAWLNGYEVEKEKRYFVKIKGNIKENMLVYGEFLKRYFFTKGFSLDDVIYSHTRKQLEDANFGWVFDCEGIDIEEVENE
ncbi:phage protein [Streptococcus pneumoniae]|nr:phage protein [Streptococcus pneumoniae]VPA24858.1 phage protein [Streptococcus pneumoniae]VQR79131.1 phage protein [Streptococcus pneumoniae]VQZ32089.1 phage protein [Streptococcus pneumoniae]VSL39092.1 phage protein [Streptococcus pneumoniae]